MAVLMANEKKLWAMRSNMKQALFDHFVGKRMKSSNKCSIMTLTLLFFIPVDSRGPEERSGCAGGV